MGYLIQGLILSAAAAIVFPACDLGWTQYKDKCIYFSNKQMYWNEAETACEKLGAFLVTIDTEDKMNFLTPFLNVFRNFHFTHYWLGAKDAPIEGEWRWIETGQPIGTFNKWAPGQPDGDTTQNCAMTSWNNTDILWYDAKCESAHHSNRGGSYYMCEKQASS